jgi:hypothetical protein
MNTDTTDNGSSGGLQGAFGDKGTRVNSISYGHPYGEQIIENAKKVLRECDTGKTLVQVQEHRNVPIQTLKGNGESGYNPQANVIYVPISSKKDTLDAKTVILLAKALRSLEQEFVGLETPDTSVDVMEYAATLHTKNLDSVLYGCKIVKELTNSSYFPVLIDELEKFGYSNLYRAYESDASHEELVEIYSSG